MSKLLARCAGVFWLLACTVGQAATYTVTTIADAGPGSLREKVALANALPGADTIRFGVSGTIVLASPLPDISDSLTIDGTGASIVISGNSTVRILHVRTSRPGQSLTLIRLNLANGRAPDRGGGGAVRFQGPGMLGPPPFTNPRTILTIVDCTFTGNFADQPPSEVTNWGGAVSVGFLGTLIVSGSTFHSNTAPSGGAVSIADNAVYPLSDRIEHRITNSTFTSNVAHGSEFECSHSSPLSCGGGAIAYYGNRSGSLTITNSTFHLNRATGDTAGSAVFVDLDSNLRLRNTIVNTGPERGACYARPYAPWTGMFTDDGGNLASDASCGFTAASSVSSVNPLLGSLRDNGGPTMTVAPLTGSPAIDSGVNSLAIDPAGRPLATDQRGFARIVGAAVDRGAYERAGSLDLTGFFFPIRNWPIFNDTWASSLVPMRFGLNGYQGMAIFAQGFPTSAKVSCDSGPFQTVAELAKTGGGTLSYDSQTQRYEYVLKSEVAWKGSCRKVTMKFIDGSSIDAFFRFN